MPLGGSLPTLLPESTGTTFYVDPDGNDTNDGSIGSPWQTLSKVNSTLTAGQKALLREGIYGDGTTSQTFTMTGTSANPITVEAFPGELVDMRIRLTPTTGHHIRFRGMHFSTPIILGGSPEPYIYVNGGADIEISENDFHTSDFSSIFANPSSARVHIIRNLFDTNGDGTSPQDHGIYCDSDAFLIIGNVIYDSFVFGIQCVADGVSIANGIIAFNTIYSNGQSDLVTPAGITLDSTGGFTQSNTLITSNIISSNNSSGVNGFGIRVFSDTGAENFSQNNLIRNNDAGAYQDTGNWLTESGDITVGSEGFIDAPNRDLRINGTSAGLGLGDPDYCLATDILGNPYSDPPDIGAYTFSSPTGGQLVRLHRKP